MKVVPHIIPLRVLVEDHVSRSVEELGNNKPAAAVALGISLRSVYRYLAGRQRRLAKLTKRNGAPCDTPSPESK